MFQVHLSAIGLDFHPVRSASRRRIQTLLTALEGREPEPGETGSPEAPAALWGDESVVPLSGRPVPLEAARAEGAAILSGAAGRLAKLISDIHGRPPLAAKIAPV
jgi:hypothetical protein